MMTTKFPIKTYNNNPVHDYYLNQNLGQLQDAKTNTIPAAKVIAEHNGGSSQIPSAFPDMYFRETTWFLTYKQGDALLFSNICFGLMNNCLPTIVDAQTMVFPLRYISTDKEHIRITDIFRAWLCDPKKSPYRCLFDKITFHKSDDGRRISVVECHDLANTNSQLLNNFFVALRMPIKSWNSIRGWHSLVYDHGFPEWQAYAITSYYSPANGDLSRYQRHTPGDHWPFNNDSGNSLNLRALRDSKPRLRANHTYHQTRTYLPCNNIWRGNDTKFFTSIGGDNKYTGVFPSAFKNCVSSTGNFPVASVVSATDLAKSMKEHFDAWTKAHPETNS